MAQPNRDPAPSSELIDEALRLVDALQRKLIIAGVRRGVTNVVSTPPPPKGDVWEQAVAEQTRRDEPPLDQVIDIVRTAAPQVVGHLGRAGSVLVGAVGQAWDVFERAREQAERERRNGSARPDGSRGGADGHH
ncbi:hypothetical protein ACQEU5_01215 [Marinactinospora thermotolerans]|uniref:Uncharacterized protein n=1 Tax=Marinactinospora thermotolerans DSM 45154 TaxID=1122192 RepID=A0A1T4MF33_9ACTN|nr:hypothetical protein [Marinactinospora thermotolerans]SJZ65491.1 hypothetical protein SAMN02745673_01084 [Marinactinospora thermotolerans DSM 45154]